MSKPIYFATTSSNWLRSRCWDNVDNCKNRYNKYNCYKLQATREELSAWRLIKWIANQRFKSENDCHLRS